MKCAGSLRTGAVLGTSSTTGTLAFSSLWVIAWGSEAGGAGTDVGGRVFVHFFLWAGWWRRVGGGVMTVSLQLPGSV